VVTTVGMRPSAEAEGGAAAPSRRGRTRAVAGPVGALVVAAVAAAVVATVDPNESGHYPSCPFLMLTGLYCPGCGTLRAAHALLHGDLTGAVDMNALAVLAIPVVVASWSAWLRRAVTGRPRSWLAPPWFPFGVLVVLALFAVARNVPAMAPWLAP
jgi:hypothetical protein